MSLFLGPYKRAFYAMNMGLGIWIWPRPCVGGIWCGELELVKVAMCLPASSGRGASTSVINLV